MKDILIKAGGYADKAVNVVCTFLIAVMTCIVLLQVSTRFLPVKSELDGRTFQIHHDLYCIYWSQHRHQGMDECGRRFCAEPAAKGRKICSQCSYPDCDPCFLVCGDISVCQNFPKDRHEAVQRIHEIPDFLCPAGHRDRGSFEYYTECDTGDNLYDRRCEECLNLVLRPCS